MTRGEIGTERYWGHSRVCISDDCTGGCTNDRISARKGKAMGELQKRDEGILALHVADGPVCVVCDTHSGYGEGNGNNPDCTHHARYCKSCQRESYPCKTRLLIEPREAEERPVRIVARALAFEQWAQTRVDGDEWDEREHWKVPVLVYMAMARAAMEVHEKLLKQSEAGDSTPIVWRHGAPQPPANVVAVKHSNGQVWTRCWQSQWRGSWTGEVLDWSRLAGSLGAATLTECSDVEADDSTTPKPVLEVDGEAAAWYIRLLDEEVARTTEQPGMVNIDWTEDGRMVGVELLSPVSGSTADEMTEAYRAGLARALCEHDGEDFEEHLAEDDHGTWVGYANAVWDAGWRPRSDESGIDYKKLYEAAMKDMDGLSQQAAVVQDGQTQVWDLLYQRGFSLHEKGFPVSVPAAIVALVERALDEMQERVLQEQGKVENAQKAAASITGISDRFSLGYHLERIQDAVRQISNAVGLDSSNDIASLPHRVRHLIEQAKEEKE